MAMNPNDHDPLTNDPFFAKPWYQDLRPDRFAWIDRLYGDYFEPVSSALESPDVKSWPRVGRLLLIGAIIVLVAAIPLGLALTCVVLCFCFAGLIVLAIAVAVWSAIYAAWKEHWWLGLLLFCFSPALLVVWLYIMARPVQCKNRFFNLACLLSLLAMIFLALCVIPFLLTLPNFDAAWRDFTIH